MEEEEEVVVEEDEKEGGEGRGKRESHMNARQDSPGHLTDTFQGCSMMLGWLGHHQTAGICQFHYNLWAHHRGSGLSLTEISQVQSFQKANIGNEANFRSTLVIIVQVFRFV